MKSKFKTLLGAILSLILVLTSVGFSFAENEVKPITKYHLDIGVISVINIYGKWDMGREYGKNLIVNPKLSFNKDVKVKRVLPIEQAESEGILWGKLTSHNIVSSLEGQDTKEKYENNFKPSSSASITNVKVTKAEGKTVAYSMNVLLKEKEKVVDMMKLYTDEYKSNGEEFAKEIYRFWGGEAGLKAENATMYNTVQNIRNGKVPKGEFYLIFAPMIIEYEDAEDKPEDESEDDGVPLAPPTVTVDGVSKCADKITWTETQSHKYKSGKTSKTCNHTYKYEATLVSVGSLKSEKQNGGATLLKSGYGFSVVLNNSITVKQTANSGSCGQSKTKAYTATVKVPNAAEVRTNWTVKNEKLRTTQGKIVALEKSSESGLKSSFITAQNKVSHHKNRQI